MRRREFITLLGGAAAAWPLAASAQQPNQMRRVAVLQTLAENDLEGQSWVNALKQGLAVLGWTDGLNRYCFVLADVISDAIW